MALTYFFTTQKQRKTWWNKFSCPAVAILTSRRYCSHLYCTAYSQRKQSGGLEIKPNGVIKKKKEKKGSQYEKCTTTNRLTVLLHWPVGVNKLAYYKMREDTLLRLSLHCFVDLWIVNFAVAAHPPILPGCAIISREQCLFARICASQAPTLHGRLGQLTRRLRTAQMMRVAVFHAWCHYA